MMEGNIGAGGGIAPGNGFQGINPPGIFDKVISHGIAEPKKTFTFPDVSNYLIGKALDGFQQFANNLSVMSITGSGQFSPGNLLQGVNPSSVKMGDMYGRGGGK